MAAEKPFVAGEDDRGWPTVVFITRTSRGARRCTLGLAERERERERECFNGGTRRDVVQVDLWKVGGRREQEANRKTEKNGVRKRDGAKAKRRSDRDAHRGEEGPKVKQRFDGDRTVENESGVGEEEQGERGERLCLCRRSAVVHGHGDQPLD